MLRRYYDAATGEEIAEREEFIEGLTHDSFVIQIPRLRPERRTATERLLAVFGQHRRDERDGHLPDVDEAAYPEECRKVVRWPNVAVSEPDIRRTMEVGDDILAELEDIERQIAGKDKVIEENAGTLDEKDRALAEKDRLIAELRGSR
uniref:PD-(D/E)XK nuclease family transposase n=1 Tax=Candidatus Kentrum sp. LFY TaxID=2126342 RepID=A0A450WWJ6_9GAMM|nr:MAG: hypothetical protein BECKLFY1418C_GA0070996_109311 [Candidatus Kentron sp. LFY]